MNLDQGHGACGPILLCWKGSFRALQTSRHRARTPCTVNYLKPLQLETHSRKLATLRQTGLAIQTAQDYSSHQHCETFHCNTGGHYPWAVLDSFLGLPSRKLLRVTNFILQRCFVQIEDFFLGCTERPGEHMLHADRRGSACNSVTTKTVVFPL